MEGGILQQVNCIYIHSSDNFTTHTCLHPGLKPTIRDLCPDDKRRVKGLVEAVARLGSEKDKLESEMLQERVALQGLLENLTNQHHRLLRAKKDILN